MTDPKWVYPLLATAAVGVFDSILAYTAMNGDWFAAADKPFGVGVILFTIIWIIVYIFIIIAWWSLLYNSPSSQLQSVNDNFTVLIILILLLHLVLFGACSFTAGLMVAAFVIIYLVIISVQAVVLGNVAASILMALVLIWVVLSTMVTVRMTTLNL